MPYFGDPRKNGKWAFSEQPPTYRQRCHYCSYNGSDQDIMAKRRIAARAFGFVRQPVYKTSCIVQPFPECGYHAKEEERLNKDVDGFVRELHQARRKRDKEILACHKAEKAYQEYKAFCRREEEWEKEMMRDEFLRTKPHARVFSNTSAVSYNILTMEYQRSYAGRRLKYVEDMSLWRANLRKLFLAAHSTGTPNFNILSWKRRPAPPMLVKPRPPTPDPPKELSGPKRTLEMQRGLKPKQVDRPADIVPPDGKPAQHLHFSAPPPPPPPQPIRDVIVNVQHPWEHL